MEVAIDVYRRVFELGTREHYRVGPDRDGLGCVEVLY